MPAERRLSNLAFCGSRTPNPNLVARGRLHAAQCAADIARADDADFHGFCSCWVWGFVELHLTGSVAQAGQRGGKEEYNGRGLDPI